MSGSMRATTGMPYCIGRCVCYSLMPVYTVWCVLFGLQVPLEVTQGAALKPKNGLFVKYELRK